MDYLRIFSTLFILCMTTGSILHFINIVEANKFMKNNENFGMKPKVMKIMCTSFFSSTYIFAFILWVNDIFDAMILLTILSFGLCLAMYLFCYMKYKPTEKAYYRYYYVKMISGIIFEIIAIVSLIVLMN